MIESTRETHDEEYRPTLGWWLLGTLVGALALHWWNRDVLNTDAIAYLRIAEYYSNGQFDLAINGYWGPLLSGLILPFLKLGIPALFAARLAMTISTLVFVMGSAQMMTVCGLARRPFLLGLIVCCSAAAIWGSQNITPDLLLAGVALIALSLTWQAFREPRSWTAAVAGMAWGAAYLTKAIALPWAMLVIGSYTLILWRERQLKWPGLLKLSAGVAVVALPWIAVLSIHSGQFTFSTSGRIAHTLAGPSDEVRYHPTFLTLHEPAEGRLTSWENPVELPYQHWSPLKSRDDFAHQIKLVVENLVKILFIITSIVPLWALMFMVGRRRRSFFDRTSALQTILPLNLLCLIYLPVYLTINEQRYFYIALPLLWIALNAQRSASDLALRLPVVSDRGRSWAFVSILLALIVSTVAYQYPPRTAGKEARELAQWLEASNHVGPVAGSGMRPGGRAGLYTAWYLGERWLGDSRVPDPQMFIQSGARLLIVSVDDPMVEALERSAEVRHLDLPLAFADKLAVFKVTR